MAREITSKHPIALVNSVNPYRIEGQKTASFEIADALGDAPDVLALPVGNAGNITAYWKGFVEYHQHGAHEQAAAHARGSRPRERRRWCTARPVEHAADDRERRSASATRRRGRRRSRRATSRSGSIEAVTDDEILAAYDRLGARRGHLLRAGIGGVRGGLLKQAAAGTSFAGKTIVCIITGSGLKDPETALKTEPPIHHVAGRSSPRSSARWVGRKPCSPASFR